MVAVPILAVVETVSALLGPLRAPADADWQATSTRVRKDWKPGDFLVAAPAWSDPVMRLHFGDLMTLEQIARLDLARFGRIWEISQRDGRDDDVRRGRTMGTEFRSGALTVRRWDRPPATLVTDFVAVWASARVSRVRAAGPAVPCQPSPDRVSCPGAGFESMQPKYLEMDYHMRRSLHFQPTLIPGAPAAHVAVEYPGARLGRELVVGAGLANAWWREVSDGTVLLKVSIDGVPLGQIESQNRSGWMVKHFDTGAFVGHPGLLRFDLLSAKPYGRQFGFAAEARNP